MVKQILLSSLILTFSLHSTVSLGSVKANGAASDDYIVNEALYDFCVRASQRAIDRVIRTNKEKDAMNVICDRYKQKVKTL